MNVPLKFEIKDPVEIIGHNIAIFWHKQEFKKEFVLNFELKYDLKTLNKINKNNNNPKAPFSDKSSR